jgi:hypothetical protein
MPLVRVPAELPDRVAVTALRRLLPRRVIGRIRPLPSAGGRSRDWGAEAAEWLVPRIALHPPRTRVRIPLLLRRSRPPDGANGSHRARLAARRALRFRWPGSERAKGEGHTEVRHDDHRRDLRLLLPEDRGKGEVRQRAPSTGRRCPPGVRPEGNDPNRPSKVTGPLRAKRREPCQPTSTSARIARRTSR